MKNAKSSQVVRFLTYAAMIAALYTVFTYLSALFGMSSGVIQLRISEALTILPALLPGVGAAASIAGLFGGCILANALTGCMVLDVIFGSIATLLGGFGTYLLRKRPYLAWLPPVISNAIIVPQILIHVYEVPDALWFLTLTVGAGELLSCGLFGGLLYFALKKRGIKG
ncbi:MAG: QueT transporter family protein [Clostridia bacterium]|nr:QueT transporter family protein [Clostridia bacterium]